MTAKKTEEIEKKTSAAKSKVAKTTKKADTAKVATIALDVAAPKPTAEKNQPKLTAEVFDLEGKILEKISLPEEIFAAKINKVLIAQAVRVYLANQRQGTASTKTRGEVEGSTRKIYRQKGTGRARHGSIRAPIFVHGGIVGGPKPRDYSLHLPQKMKRRALFSALTDKLNNRGIKILKGLEKIEPKTKNFVNLIDKLGLTHKKKKILVITASENENLKRASRNVEGVSITAAKRLNTHDVLNNRELLFMKEAIEELKTHFLKKAKTLAQV